MNRSQFIRSICSAAFACIHGMAPAQQTSPIRLLVGFPAGGAVDVVARAFADQLRQVSGRNVIVDNRAGASGKLAIDALLNAPADGLTLTVMPASVLALVPMIVNAAKYDAVRDFTAIGNVAEYGFGIAAGPASGARDLPSYKAWAKTHATQSSFATPGSGTPQHFIGAQLQKALSADLAHIPYRGGATAINDVMGGQVPLLITTEQLLVPHEGQGKLNTLFITSRQRNPLMSKVPTARETGVAQLEISDWFGLFAKAGTSVATVQQLRADLAKVMASKEYLEAMAKLGYFVPLKQATDFAQQLNAERAAWAERVQLSGFKPTE